MDPTFINLKWVSDPSLLNFTDMVHAEATYEGSVRNEDVTFVVKSGDKYAIIALDNLSPETMDALSGDALPIDELFSRKSWTVLDPDKVPGWHEKLILAHAKPLPEKQKTPVSEKQKAPARPEQTVPALIDDPLATYQGELDSRGLAEGEGTVIKNGEVVQKGIFKNGQLIRGWKEKDGVREEGGFQRGRLIGPGKTYKNGVLAQKGLFADGRLLSGTKIDGNLIQEGPFDQAGRLKGYGRVLEKNVLVKEGIFQAGRLVDGKLWKEGLLYRGLFDSAERLTGDGNIFKKGTIVMGGRFVEGQLVKGNQRAEGIQYSGTFDKELRLHGWGKVIEGGKVIKEGTFVHGVLDQGTLIDSEGTIYEGLFDHEGRLYGPGKVTKKGITEEGFYREGKPIKRDSTEAGPIHQHLLARRAAELTKKAPLSLTAVIPKEKVAKLLFNVVLKGKKDTTLKTSKEHFEGLVVSSHAEFREASALSLLAQATQDKRPPVGLQTERELRGLETIAQHRTNFARYAALLEKVNETQDPSTLDLLIKQIKNDLEALKEPGSPNIVTLEDGSRSFFIPGGSEEHFVAYEFRQKEGRYFLIMHNRGEGSDDYRIYGSISCQDPVSGKECGKTVVAIELPEEAIGDTGFLTTLIQARGSSDSTIVNDYLDHHFLRSGKGKLVRSPTEMLLNRLHKKLNHPLVADADKEKIRAKMLELMALEPAFNSYQLYGTCTESNSTSAEKMMAPAATRQALKAHTTAALVEKAKGKLTLTTQQKASIVRVKTLSLEQLAHLKRKVAAGPKKMKDLSQISSEAEELLKSVKPDRDPTNVKKQAQAFIENFNTLYDIEDDGGLPAGRIEQEKMSNELNILGHQCNDLLRALKKEKSSKEYQQLREIFSAINQSIKVNREEPFNTYRPLKTQLIEAFNALDFDACKTEKEKLDLVDKSGDVLKAPLAKLQAVPKGDPKLTLHFYEMLEESISSLEEALASLPSSKKALLEKQLKDMGRECVIQKRCLQAAQIEKGTHNDQGQLEGSDCQVLKPDGTTLIKRGTFRAGQLIEGIYHDPYGNTLQGTFVSGKHLQGEGQITLPSGVLKKGTFKQNSLVGPRSIIFPDGRTFEGESDQRGKLTYPNGEIHEGTFDLDYLLEGPGKITRNGVLVEEGTFVKGKLT